MRFTNFVRGDFAMVGKRLAPQADTVVAGVGGGYEVWLQVEVALHMLHRNNVFFDRERRYPNSNQRCDFAIDPRNAQGNIIWVELKVLRSAGGRALAQSFLSDVSKMLAIRVGQNQTGGAIAYAPRSGLDVLQVLRSSVPAVERGRYLFATWNRANPPAQLTWANLSASISSISNADSVVAYRTVFS